MREYLLSIGVAASTTVHSEKLNSPELKPHLNYRLLLIQSHSLLKVCCISLKCQYHSSEERRALRSSSSSTGRWLKENGTRNSPPRYKITSQQIYEKHPRPRLELFQKLVNVSWFVKIFLREHFSSNKLRRNPFNSGDGTAVDSPLHLAAEKQNTHTDYCASTDFHRHKPARSSSLEGRRFGK